MLIERVLDLRGVDQLAAGDNRIFLAVDDVEVAFGIDRRQIAGTEPAVGKRLFRRLGQLPITRSDAVAAGENLADGAADGRHRRPVIVDDSQAYAEGRAARFRRIGELLLPRELAQEEQFAY